jgi:hypothetical protein
VVRFRFTTRRERRMSYELIRVGTVELTRFGRILYGSCESMVFLHRGIAAAAVKRPWLYTLFLVELLTEGASG